MNRSNLKKYRSILLPLILVLGLVISSCSGSEGGSPASDEKITVISNPLTGETAEQGYDENASNQRIAAFVVENAQEARPQWGMDDPQYSPDIVLQGEVEAGITRTLWMYADYNKLPEIIGPMRSARPPYIKFSELFDAIFIHWGQSGSKGKYVGAATIFNRDKVDHINQMSFEDKTGLFDRDSTRAVAMEHTGILYGSKVPAAIEEAGFRTEPKEYTHLNFSDLAWLIRVKPAETVRVNYSDRASWEKTFWTYNSEDNKYHTANFNNDFVRDNLLILFDDTEYIDKENYSGGGATLTYCNYKLNGGKGYLVSQGTYKDIEWRVEDQKLILIDVEATQKKLEREAAEAAEATEEGESADSEEAESEEATEPVEVDASLYPGKTWIGWVSANNGGSVEISDGEE